MTPAEIPFAETEYGFLYGAAEIERMSRHDSGAVTIGLKTPKYPIAIQIYVTKTGKVRIFSNGEWTAPGKEGK